MDLDKIEGLVKIIENSSLTEFTLKEGDMKITMSKLDHPPVIPHGMPMMPPPAGMPGMPPCEPAGMMPPGGSEQSANSKEEEKFFITSPIVGTFYSAPLPDAPAFVKVGDHVKNGQTTSNSPHTFNTLNYFY
jgi:acetyl-CoA carboxylase biotin carboxyl carrier protein